MQQNKYSRSSSYSYNDVYNEVNVPFAWEYKPGLSKAVHQLSNPNLVLQPPPCSSFGRDRVRVRVDGTQSPAILCAVQPSLKVKSIRMENRKEEGDPFLEAFKICTRSPFIMLKGSPRVKKANKSGSVIRKYMDILSCSYSGDVKKMI